MLRPGCCGSHVGHAGGVGPWGAVVLDIGVSSANTWILRVAQAPGRTNFGLAPKQNFPPHFYSDLWLSTPLPNVS